MATEKRLIDANALEEHIADCFGYHAVDILHEVATFPTVDAMEVVHCLECINYKENGCKLTHGEFEPEPEFFCGYGERKDNG